MQKQCKRSKQSKQANQTKQTTNNQRRPIPHVAVAEVAGAAAPTALACEDGGNTAAGGTAAAEVAADGGNVDRIIGFTAFQKSIHLHDRCKTMQVIRLAKTSSMLTRAPYRTIPVPPMRDSKAVNCPSLCATGKSVNKDKRTRVTQSRTHTQQEQQVASIPLRTQFGHNRTQVRCVDESVAVLVEFAECT